MIYLDYQATSPLAPEAFAAMEPWLRDHCANPHSAHAPGRSARAAVEVARDQIAALLPAGGRVIFTSGATEALNLAIKGVGATKIAALATEHAAVLDCVAHVGGSVLPVGNDGHWSPDAMPDCDLFAAMLVNNEIGVIHDVAAVAGAAHARNALLLCDAVQGFGRIPIPQGPDLIAISAHKIHGPKGIGALWIREGVAIAPQMHGGGQEGGLRSGTLSPALCAGFGAAAALAAQRMAADLAHISGLAEHARALFPHWEINGDVASRWPGNLNLRLAGLDVARLLSDCRTVAFSAGSACASGSGRPSHVLRAIGLCDTAARASIRLGFGRYTTMDEIDVAAQMIQAAVREQGLA